MLFLASSRTTHLPFRRVPVPMSSTDASGSTAEPSTPSPGTRLDSTEATGPADEDRLAWIDTLTDVLDTRFRIPGTNIRFGGDFLLGLVPGAGDAVSLGISGLLISGMARHGASGRLIAKMLGNVLLDTLVGTIPVLGNFFDLYYKANYRNLRLMREYAGQGRHRGSAWPIVLAIGVFFVVLIIGLVVGVALLFRWLAGPEPAA